MGERKLTPVLKIPSVGSQATGSNRTVEEAVASENGSAEVAQTATGARPEETDVVWEIVDVAKFLHVHPNMVYKMAKNRKLPCTRIGNRWKFLRNHIVRWLESRVSCSSNPALPRVQ